MNAAGDVAHEQAPPCEPTSTGSPPTVNGEAIYSQDGDSYRHQDGLMWGRFQTASTAEAALLLAWHTLPQGPDRSALLLAGALIVFGLCLLALKDSDDAGRHLKRIKAFEQANPLPGTKWPKRVSGVAIMKSAIVVTYALNIWLLWRS